VLDEEKLLSFASARADRMASDEKRSKLLEEMTGLEASPEFSKQLVETFVEMESVLGDEGLLSERFLEHRVSEGLSVEVTDSERSYQGLFTCREMLDSDTEGVDNKIQISVKGNRLFASRLRMLAVEAGIALDEQASIDLSVLGTSAHEYGHYMEHVLSAGPKLTKDPRFETMAEVLNPLSVSIDGQHEKSGVVSERFSQSVANVVLSKKIESMGFSADQANQLRRLALDTDPGEASKYQEMLQWASDKGISSENLSGVLREAHFFFKKRGMDREAQKCLSRVRSLGYYIEPYTSADLKGIIASVDEYDVSDKR